MQYKICKKTEKDGKIKIVHLDFASTYSEAKQKALLATASFGDVRIVQNNIVIAKAVPTGQGQARIDEMDLPEKWIRD